MLDSHDPYQAPRANLDASVKLEALSTPMAMPRSVKTTVAIVSATAVMIGYGAIVQGQTPLVQLGLIALVLWGLVRRKALAWQWTRLGAVLGFVATAGVWSAHLLAGRWSGGPTAFLVANGISLMMSLLFLLPVFLLSTRESRGYFGLVCPTCGSTKVKAGDFLYREKRCKACSGSWR
jgi:hypothetical protein